MWGDPDLSADESPPGESFLDWLAQYTWRFERDVHDPLGRVADSTFNDRCLPRTNDLSLLLIHMWKEHDADDVEVRALAGAYVKWSTDRAIEETYRGWPEQMYAWLAAQDPEAAAIREAVMRGEPIPEPMAPREAAPRRAEGQ